MNNFNEAIGYRTRDLPSCSTMSQSTVPPRAPYLNKEILLFLTLSVSELKLHDIGNCTLLCVSCKKLTLSR